MLTQDLPVIAPNDVRERTVSPAPVLISEQEVALATAITLAAAMVLRNRPPARRRWMEATHGLLASVRRPFTAQALDRPARPAGAKHYAFLENACMAREMERL